MPLAPTLSYSALEDEIGTVEVGKSADLVLVAGEPLDDIEVLADPGHVEVVLKDGAVVRDRQGRMATPDAAARDASAHGTAQLDRSAFGVQSGP